MTFFPKDTAVLIVDDSRSMRRIIRQFFENSGAGKIMEAGNGKAALEKGADAYIVKPVTERVFMEAVLSALDRDSGLTGSGRR